jgi:hypothetical protein
MKPFAQKRSADTVHSTSSYAMPFTKADFPAC